MTAIYAGVRDTYQAHKLPFVEVGLPRADAYAVGAFLQFKMIEVMYLAHLIGVNAFDQPDVEEYKERTRRYVQTS